MQEKIINLLITCRFKTVTTIKIKTGSITVKSNKISMTLTYENRIDSHSQKISHLQLKADCNREADLIRMHPVTFPLL